MRVHFSLGNGLTRAAILLGFLGSLIASSQAVVGAREATPSFGLSRFAHLDNAEIAARATGFTGATYQNDTSPFNSSDSMLSEQGEIGVPDEFGVAFEDSIEMFRVDIQERTFGIDQTEIGSKVVSKVARNARSNISPPLLV